MYYKGIELLKLLEFCTKKQQKFFIRLHSRDNQNRSLSDLIENMTVQEIKSAFGIVERTIKKNEERLDLKLKKIIDTINENKNRVCK